MWGLLWWWLLDIALWGFMVMAVSWSLESAKNLGSLDEATLVFRDVFLDVFFSWFVGLPQTISHIKYLDFWPNMM